MIWNLHAFVFQYPLRRITQWRVFSANEVKTRRYQSDLKDQKDTATYLENLLLDLLTFVIEQQKQKNKFKKIGEGIFGTFLKFG